MVLKYRSIEENKNSNLVDDGCHWKSDTPKVNNYLGAGFALDKLGCSCLRNKLNMSRVGSGTDRDLNKFKVVAMEL